MGPPMQQRHEEAPVVARSVTMTTVLLSHPLVTVPRAPNAEEFRGAAGFGAITFFKGSHTRHWKLAQLQTSIEQTVQQSSRLLDSHTGLQDLLRKTGLDQVFGAVSGAAPNAPPTSPRGATATSAKLDMRGMTILNQVVTLALQLRRDVELPNHKYMAHQIALLYQSLTNSREDLRKFRPEIEGQFDTIKASCSASVPEPRLTPEQREWIYNLTTRILTEALFTGRSITPSARIMEFLRTL